MRRTVRLICLCLSTLGLWCVPSATADTLQGKLGRIAGSSAGRGAAISVLDLESGETVISHGATAALKPASVLKLLITTVTLKRFKPYYKFKTEFWIGVSPEYRDRLYVRPSGDPSLTTEDAWRIARAIRHRGIKQIRALEIDATRFVSESPPRGQRAYETGAAAMSFNHNTIGFEICPAAPGQAAIVSPSPLEANVSLLGRIATTRKGGIYNFDKLTSGNDPSTLKFRLSGRYAASQGCKMVYRSVDNPARYFATTFSSLLESNGIRVIGSSRASSGNTNAGNSADDDSQPSGKELSGPPPVGYRLLYTHLSKPLELVVRDLNHYSNNFVAEQLLYALGDTPVGLSRMQGLRQLEEYLVSLGVPIEHFTLRDASGLSHDNRLTTAALATVIRDAYHDPEVRASFVASLPIAGRSGTVKSRYAGWDAAAVHAKSGTLRDVVSVAGIVFSRKGHRYAFAVINNKVRAKNRALKFQESVLSVLVEH